MFKLFKSSLGTVLLPSHCVTSPYREAISWCTTPCRGSVGGEICQAEEVQVLLDDAASSIQATIALRA